MPVSTILALAQGGPRFDGNTVNVLIIALVAGAVALVFWASRPSVIARYQTRRPREDASQASRAPAPDATPPAEKEPRA